MIGVAARVWQHASVADSTRSALAKLRAAGIEPDTAQLSALAPSVQATEPSFDPLWSAVLERSRVSFTYRDGERRTLEPWGLTASKGRWYVIGHDVDRQATRMFKLSRIADRPRKVSRPGAYAVPDDLDLRALARSLAPREPTETALLAIRKGRAPGAGPPRASRPPPGPRCRTASRRSPWPTATAGRWPRTSSSYGADVVVLAPAELRDGCSVRSRPPARGAGGRRDRRGGT